jgi:hypothetical protein
MSLSPKRLSEPIPGYKLIERLGGGGFGEVWKAEAPGGLLKAIKFVYGDLEGAASEDQQRAEQELKALSRMKTVRHPYVLSLERFDIIDGQLLIVTELADRNLWDRFRECRAQGLPGIPRDELLRYLEETAEALDLMNREYQLQHLDIKPQNLFLVHNHIKVADFGLVKDLQGMTASVTGGVTPVYAAPETFDGRISRFCDQYSLAIVYQEILTGQRPFTASNVHQIVLQHMQGTPDLSGLPPGDQAAIGRALSKAPGERHASCMDLVRQLQASIISAVAVAPARMPPARTGTAVLAGAAPTEVRTPGKGTVTTPVFRKKADSGESRLSDTPLNAGALAPPLPTPAPPSTDEGELVPALVIGVGQAGLMVLRALRGALREWFGQPDRLPHLRLLYLDTDPEALQAATAAPEDTALDRREVLPARLHRAPYYLSPRHGRPCIDSWFDPALLYRIQRQQVTGGMRALGRLALLGNYRPTVRRLELEIEACTAPEALARAVACTGLQLQSAEPRVYLVAGLGGGTGSGMVIDLAYLTRDLLRRRGQHEPAVDGLLLLPEVPEADSNPVRKRELGNAFAALLELRHLAKAPAGFAAHYDDQEPPLVDAGPAFRRCTVLAPRPHPGGAEALAVMAGQFLARELTTGLGRLAGHYRAELASGAASNGAVCQTFGMYRICWPHRMLLAWASRRLCRRLVERWMTKDSRPVQDALGVMIREHWEKNQLDAETLINALQAHCEESLGHAPETAFANLTDPVRPPPGRSTEIDLAAISTAAEQLLALVGVPPESALGHLPGSLEELLRQRAEQWIKAAQDELGAVVLDMVEQPTFRLAGAEEAARQIVAMTEAALTSQDALFQELSHKSLKVFERLRFLLGHLGDIAKKGRRGGPIVHELMDLLTYYPKWRFQALVLQNVLFAYTSLRGCFSDHIRELGFCRARMLELQKMLDQADNLDHAAAPPAGTFLLPAGSKSLEDAGSLLFPPPTPAQLLGFDARIESLLQEQFTSLTHVCTTPANLLKQVQAALVAEAEVFVSGHLDGSNVADAFVSRHSDEREAVQVLRRALDRAAPTPIAARSTPVPEFTILALPPSSQEDAMNRLAHRAAPDVTLLTVTGTDDLLFYREQCQVELNPMEQLGPLGQEAYQQMLAAPHFTPHSRGDITDWCMCDKTAATLGLPSSNAD